ncbi:MAG: NAD(P)H-dependent oxidoreductase subunit E [Anaerolineae bacterium]|jgi:NADH-quinone oxidoreductase subunit E
MNQQAAVRDLDLSVVGEMIEQFGTDSDAVIPILLGLQDAFGYLPIEALQRVTEKTDITPAQIYGVATFYAQFRLEPLGEHMVRVCHGTSCHVRGIVGITETICDLLDLDGEGTTEDGKYTLEKVACLGCCSLSPVIMVDDKVYGGLTRKRAKRIFKQLQREDTKQ